MIRSFNCIILILLTAPVALAQPTVLQRINKIGSFAGEGIVADIQPGEIVIQGDNGRRAAFLIQNKDERFLSLDGNDYIVRMPSNIEVTGRLPGKLLERGMVVRFRGEINRSGRTGTPVKRIDVIAGDQSSLKLEPLREPEGRAFVPCDFVGIIQRFTNQSMYLVVPKTRWTPTQRIAVRVADDAYFDLQADDLNRVQDGDRVVAFRGDKMANGALVIRDIKVELTPEREVATPTFSDQLYLKYSKLSDDPADPRQENSDHFILHTDISPRSARVLLEKLETMYDFLSRYYRTRPKAPIACYVVADLDHFRGKLPPVAISKIRNRSGVTASKSRSLIRRGRKHGKQTVATVYSCDDHDVVQHEAVHAWCSMAFGTTGPVWYAEGMAEIGQYWEPNQQAVQIDPVVIEYLTSNQKKKMQEIIAAGQITGDSWKAYAWRWALCHLLIHNPNYSRRFRDLGMNMMAEKTDSFDRAFGKVADQIAFEYDQFVSNFDNGYRADLCAWQWCDDARAIENRARFPVKAQAGWQATGLTMREGQAYDFVCVASEDKAGNKRSPTWKISSIAGEVSPDGDSRGFGKLIGVVLSDYQLSEPFEIGSRRFRLRSPASGQLYVRCRDRWNALDDNEGEIQVYVRRSK